MFSIVFESDFNTLKDNNVSGSILAGIRLNVLATGNVLKDNTVTSNPAGIEFLVTPTGSAIGNELKGNRIETNTCGLKGPTAGNSLKDNSFQGNVHGHVLVDGVVQDSARRGQCHHASRVDCLCRPWPR